MLPKPIGPYPISPHQPGGPPPNLWPKPPVKPIAPPGVVPLPIDPITNQIIGWLSAPSTEECQQTMQQVYNGLAAASTLLNYLEHGFEDLQSQLVNLLKNCVGTKNVTLRPGHTKEECLLSIRDAIRRLQAAIDRCRELRKKLIECRNYAAKVDCNNPASGDIVAPAEMNGATQCAATVIAAVNDALNTYKEWLAAVEAIRRKCKCVDIPPEPLGAGINHGVFAYGGGLPSYL